MVQFLMCGRCSSTGWPVKFHFVVINEDVDMAGMMGQVRRSLDLVTARATARCLLNRLEVVGYLGHRAH